MQDNRNTPAAGAQDKGAAIIRLRAPQRPTPAQRRWLRRGLDQPGGKLPLFAENGTRVNIRTVDACISAGWAERWFENPLKPDWRVCRLTDTGRLVATGGDED